MGRSRNALAMVIPFLLLACEGPDTQNGMMDQDAAPATETAPVGAAAPMDRAQIESEVDRVRDAWLEAGTAGDAARVASLYADDAVLVTPDGEVAQGRQAIQEGLQFEGITNLEITSTDMVAGSEVATDMGTFSQTIRTPDGAEMTQSGHYLVVLRRQADGMWRITQHLAAVPMSMPQEGQM